LRVPLKAGKGACPTPKWFTACLRAEAPAFAEAATRRQATARKRSNLMISLLCSGQGFVTLAMKIPKLRLWSLFSLAKEEKIK